MVKSGVYQIVLKEDGRSYIGSAVNIKNRWNAHKLAAKRNKTKQVIAKAIAKYGPDSFNWIVLEYCEVDQLLVREQHWLDTIRPFADEGNGFNVRKTADSNIGIKRSLESRKKQSQTMLGVPKTAEHKQKMRESWHNNRGDEYYAALRERITGEKNPAKRPDVREKISKAMTGKGWKDDKCRVEKHVAARKGKQRSDEAKENMRKAQQKNKTRSNEARETFYLAQRVLYEITKPDGNTFQMYSRELKELCITEQLQYANLISTANTNRPYKGGWIAKRL